MGIKHAAVKASREKGYATEWNDDHVVTATLVINSESGGSPVTLVQISDDFQANPPIELKLSYSSYDDPYFDIYVGDPTTLVARIYNEGSLWGGLMLINSIGQYDSGLLYLISGVSIYPEDGSDPIVDIYKCYLDIHERTDPPAPPANTARIYAKDNGAGKTQLVVRFPTGAVQVIATEP